jgi:hypothetical protein
VAVQPARQLVGSREELTWVGLRDRQDALEHDALEHDALEHDALEQE